MACFDFNFGVWSCDLAFLILMTPYRESSMKAISLAQWPFIWATGTG